MKKNKAEERAREMEKVLLLNKERGLTEKVTSEQRSEGGMEAALGILGKCSRQREQPGHSL